MAILMATMAQPETHIKRQATQHDCLPSLLSGGDKLPEIVYDDEKHVLYWTNYSNLKAGQKSILPAQRAIEPTKEEPFVLLGSPFTSVSTVSRGHFPGLPGRHNRARIFKHSWSPGIDSKE
jgi:hypothetical protein